MMSSSSKNRADGVRRKLFQYSPHKVGLALDAIKKGMKVSTASKTYNIPRTTLRHKLSGEAPETSGHVGPQAVLGNQIENELVAWIKECARVGFPINKEGLLDSVKKIVKKGGLKTPFINDRPSRSWFEGFMARHPDLRQKHAEYINKARALISEEKIRKWFQEVSSLLAENLMILEEPSRIWNCDETAFFLAPKGGLILAEKGQHVYDTSKNSDKENITTLFTVNALGEYAPPLTVYKYKRMSSEVIQNVPDSWGVGKTDKGWMTGEAFYEYIGNIFIPYLKAKEIELPIILFLDGHKSHLTMQLSKLCRENGIIVVALVPNTTHMLQPLDVAVFYPLKQNWRKLVKKWRIEKDGQEITKFNLPSALHSLLVNNETFANNIKAGFKTCGLYPFGPDFVNYKRIVKSNSDSKENHDVITKFTITESSYLAYLESKINPILLKDFYATFESGIDWEGHIEASMLYDTWLAFKNDTAVNTRSDQAVISTEFQDTCTSAYFHNNADGENSARQTDTESKDNPRNECSTSPSLIDNNYFQEDSVKETASQKVDNPRNKDDAVQKDGNTFDKPCVSSSQLVSCDQEGLAQLTPESNDTLDQYKCEDPCTSSHLDTSNLKEGGRKEEIQNDKNKKKSEFSSNLQIFPYTARDLVRECVLYPGKVVPKNTRKAMYVPSVITSNKWWDIMQAAENEKKQKQINKKKTGMKMKVTKKKVGKQISSSDEDGEVEYMESDDSEWNEQSDTKSNEEEMIDQENMLGNKQLRGSEQRKRKRPVTEDSSSESVLRVPVPSSQISNSFTNIKRNENLERGSYVIIKYEGEYFPGEIETIDKGLYEISTMTLSTGNTFRWPERPDKIWYKKSEIVEIISPPVKHNNRGFFKVKEMDKFLPDIYS